MKALELSSKDDDAYYNSGNAYKALRKLEEAIEDYTQALVDSKYTYAYYNRGNAYKALGKFELAIADYTKVIELNPT